MHLEINTLTERLHKGYLTFCISTTLIVFPYYNPTSQYKILVSFSYVHVFALFRYQSTLNRSSCNLRRKITIDSNSNSGTKLYPQIKSNWPKYRCSNVYNNYRINLHFLRFRSKNFQIPKQRQRENKMLEGKDINKQLQMLSKPDTSKTQRNYNQIQKFSINQMSPVLS